MRPPLLSGGRPGAEKRRWPTDQRFPNKNQLPKQDSLTPYSTHYYHTSLTGVPCYSALLGRRYTAVVERVASSSQPRSAGAYPFSCHPAPHGGRGSKLPRLRSGGSRCARVCGEPPGNHLRRGYLHGHWARPHLDQDGKQLTRHTRFSQPAQACVRQTLNRAAARETLPCGAGT